MPGQGQSSSVSPIQIGDLVGIPGKGAEALGVIAVVRNLQRGRAQLRPLPPEKDLVLPLRQLELIAPCPSPDSETARDPSAAPWNLSPEGLSAAAPRLRDLAAAWEMLTEASSAEKLPELSLCAFTELVCNRSDPLQQSACWLWLHGSQTFFRVKQGFIQPRPLEELKRLRQERQRQHLAAMRQEQWRNALRERQLIDADQLGDPQSKELLELRLWASGQSPHPLTENLRSLLQQVRCSSEPSDLRHLLADVGLWPRHHLPSLQGSSWQKGFSKELLSEAENLARSVEDIFPGDSGREDLTGLHTVTIDDDDTMDVDDGLSVEWRADGCPMIWIHVADPGRLIVMDSPLDQEARRRGTSLYLAGGMLPMFPELLATGAFSLRQGKCCAAWSLRIHLTPDGAIAETTIHRSWVKPSYRLSYADADELLELAPPQERDLLTLHALMQRRRQWRASRGALFLDQAEGRIRQGEEGPQGEGARLEIIEPTASRVMVAEAMILAGAALAEYGNRHALPLPYRSQPAASLPSAEELEGLPAGPARLAAIKKCLTRGVIGIKPQSHFSLGLSAYVQATSPIRRYGDLMVQRQLAAHLEGKTPLDPLSLNDVLSTVEMGVREGLAITREDQRHWQQVWFSEHRGQQWRGIFLRWLREDHHLALVHLESLGMDLPTECHGSPLPGHWVIVRVRDVDPLGDRLRLEARCH